jgi:diacylglycerol kinase family enzyme
VPVRALLIVNPRATSTTRLRRDVIASALASAVKLDVVETRYRGHASSLAASAGSDGYGLVLTLGGDGTVNEVVNGMLAGHDDPPPAAELPAIAPLPGGSGNVFAGAVGLPRDPVDATGQILQALAQNRQRTIGLGNADGRYFTINSGVGLDAEVVRAVQGVRATGRQATPSLYVRLAVRQFYGKTDRSSPALWIEPQDGRAVGPVFASIVSNTTPWTYLGDRELNANPQARFEAGLDVLAMRSLSSFSALYAVGQMFTTKGRRLHGRGILTFHDQPAVVLRADRPAAFQIDGEYVGEREHVRLRSIPRALRVVALRGLGGADHHCGVCQQNTGYVMNLISGMNRPKYDGRSGRLSTAGAYARHVTDLTPNSGLTFA